MSKEIGEMSFDELDELKEFIKKSTTEISEVYHYRFVEKLSKKKASERSGLSPRAVSIWSKFIEAILYNKRLQVSSGEAERIKSKVELLFQWYPAISQPVNKEIKRRIEENI